MRKLRPTAIAFSGLDGAGKSSQTQLLREELARRGLAVETAWVPVAINPSLGQLKLVADRMLTRAGSPRRARSASPAPEAPDPGRRLVRRSPPARHAWSTVVTLANVYSHWRSLLRHAGAADVVIFDRYAIDTAVRLHTWYGGLGSVAVQEWLTRSLSPRPACAYLLDVPAERALARKVDRWDIETLRRQATLYREACRRFGVRRLDGERDPEALASEIAADVLSRIGRKEPARSAVDAPVHPMTAPGG